MVAVAKSYFPYSRLLIVADHDRRGGQEIILLIEVGIPTIGQHGVMQHDEGDHGAAQVIQRDHAVRRGRSSESAILRSRDDSAGGVKHEEAVGRPGRAW